MARLSMEKVLEAYALMRFQHALQTKRVVDAALRLMSELSQAEQCDFLHILQRRRLSCCLSGSTGGDPDSKDDETQRKQHTLPDT